MQQIYQNYHPYCHNGFSIHPNRRKTKRENIKGKQKANQTHFEVGKRVRKTIQELGGTMPEHLPAIESIKKIAKKNVPKKLKINNN